MSDNSLYFERSSKIYNNKKMNVHVSIHYLCINANLSKNNECLDGMTTCSWRFQNLASSIKQATLCRF